MTEPLVASIVISTYNRREALRETIDALRRQDLSADRYEVIVVDDGSSDGTAEALQELSARYDVRTVRHERNRGVSAGRNSGIRIASGRYLIFVSDDVLVPDTFIAQHVDTLERFPGAWVGGQFRQLDGVTETPFGRYLEQLEGQFEQARKNEPIAPGLWEMRWPTARNLSLPRADLDRIGLFDEEFVTCCEDQDLAERARRAGIRFIFNAAIECVHNDQAADLARYCNFQARGARDTALLCAKYPDLHGAAPIATANGPINARDGVVLAIKKLAKRGVSRRSAEHAFHKLLGCAETLRLPEPVLWRGYTLAIGAATFRGWRQAKGLRVRAPAPFGSQWPIVSVAIILYRSEETVAATVGSVKEELASGYAELIAVDNASPDASRGEVERAYPQATLIRSSENNGFAAGANLAWARVRGRYWLLLNPDATLAPGAIHELAAWMDAHPELAAASPALADADGSNVRPAGRALPSVWLSLVELLRLHRLLPARVRARWMQGPYWQDEDQLNAGWVPATALMVRREAVEQVGLLDESFGLYGEDLEWCWRMRRAGWRVGACNSVVVRHRESHSSVQEFGRDETSFMIASSEIEVVRRMRGRAAAVTYAAAMAAALAVESGNPRRSPDRRADARRRSSAWRRALRASARGRAAGKGLVPNRRDLAGVPMRPGHHGSE